MKKVSYPDNKLTRKMYELGFNNVRDFCLNSRVNDFVSTETIRQMILHNRRTIEPIFIKVLQALKFTPNEIKELLIEYKYTDFVDLIGDHHGVKLTEKQNALISIFDKISDRRPQVEPSVINFLDSICISSEIDCFEELQILRQNEIQQK